MYLTMFIWGRNDLLREIEFFAPEIEFFAAEKSNPFTKFILKKGKPLRTDRNTRALAVEI